MFRIPKSLLRAEALIKIQSWEHRHALQPHDAQPPSQSVTLRYFPPKTSGRKHMSGLEDGTTTRGERPTASWDVNMSIFLHSCPVNFEMKL